jgi:hypothetical protein
VYLETCPLPIRRDECILPFSQDFTVVVCPVISWVNKSNWFFSLCKDSGETFHSVHVEVVTGSLPAYFWESKCTHLFS